VYVHQGEAKLLSLPLLLTFHSQNKAEPKILGMTLITNFNPRAELNSFPQEGEARLLSLYRPICNFLSR